MTAIALTILTHHRTDHQGPLSMLLHSTLAAAMMPGTMGEQREPNERTANEPPERLTFAEAGERLNLSPDAVRMRAKRGKLATVRIGDRPYVLWPQPEQPHERRTERTPFANRSAVQNDERLIARLESEVAYLRSALDAEMEARRRADHLVARVMDRLPEISAGLEDALRTHERAAVARENPDQVPDSLIERLRRLLGR
jgi:hypothetical protein